MKKSKLKNKKTEINNRNKTIDKIKKNQLSSKKENNSFDVIIQKPKIQNIKKVSDFSINETKKDNKKDIEFKSEYRKSKIFSQDNKKSDDKSFDNFTQSSLKDYIDKEAQIVKKNVRYSKFYKNKKNNAKSRDKELNKDNNSSFDSNLKKNFNDNISNISPKEINDNSEISIKSKINKINFKNDYSTKGQTPLLKLDLRSALSKIQTKKKYNNNF